MGIRMFERFMPAKPSVKRPSGVLFHLRDSKKEKTFFVGISPFLFAKIGSCAIIIAHSNSFPHSRKRF